MKQAGEQRLLREKMRVQSIADKVEILSPQNTLRRGYTLTMKNGKAVTKAEDLKAGECVITIFADGEVKSIVE
jgi:exodeoxyribonuclease VII large subunit